MSLSTFFSGLVPKEKKFFPMFEQIADQVLSAAKILEQIFDESDPAKELSQFSRIKEMEHNADDVVQDLFEQLDATFITPFDREDIHLLTSSLDTVLDMINSIAHRMHMYQPKTVPDECKQISSMIVKGCGHILEAVSELKTMKKSGKILKIVRKISKIETESDEVYHMGISNLFKKEKDAIELIKKKEIIETLERTCDKMEDVSDVLKTIILKNA